MPPSSNPLGSGAPKIVDVAITPVAVLDPPLLNASGVHQPYQLRAVIELRTDAGLVGLSEAYGDDPTLANLRKARQSARLSTSGNRS